LRTACSGCCRHDQRLDLLAGLLCLVHHGRHQFLVVGIQVGHIARQRLAGRRHLGRHHHHVVVAGSVSANAFSSMNRFCTERIETSLW